MTLFHIRYRDTQGTLMRLLNAVSRRAIAMPYMEAAPQGPCQRLTLTLAVTPKQAAQLLREWNATIDVVEAREVFAASSAESAALPQNPREHWAVPAEITQTAVAQA